MLPFYFPCILPSFLSPYLTLFFTAATGDVILNPAPTPMLSYSPSNTYNILPLFLTFIFYFISTYSQLPLLPTECLYKMTENNNSQPGGRSTWIHKINRDFK